VPCRSRSFCEYRPNRRETAAMNGSMVMYDEEYQLIKAIISRLCGDANAKLVFLVDKNGQQIACHGEVGQIDTTSLASLTAGNVAATDGLARLIGEKE